MNQLTPIPPHQHLFSLQPQRFFISNPAADSPTLNAIKLSILTSIATESTASLIFNEFKVEPHRLSPSIKQFYS